MLKEWLNKTYLNATTGVKNVLRKENGDTNFISILIILGIVILLAGIFMGFKDSIVEQIQTIIDGFTIK